MRTRKEIYDQTLVAVKPFDPQTPAALTVDITNAHNQAIIIELLCDIRDLLVEMSSLLKVVAQPAEGAP